MENDHFWYYYVSSHSYERKLSFHHSDSTYNKKRHTEENDQELIKCFEHRIYTFYKHLWWTSHGSSHFIIQLITDYFSNERQKFSVLFYGSYSTKPTILLFTLPGCRFFALFAVAMDIFGAIYHETAAVCIYHLQLKMILNISLVHDYYML